jgi:hypothetical protein
MDILRGMIAKWPHENPARPTKWDDAARLWAALSGETLRPQSIRVSFSKHRAMNP